MSKSKRTSVPAVNVGAGKYAPTVEAGFCELCRRRLPRTPGDGEPCRGHLPGGPIATPNTTVSTLHGFGETGYPDISSRWRAEPLFDSLGYKTRSASWREDAWAAWRDRVAREAEEAARDRLRREAQLAATRRRLEEGT